MANRYWIGGTGSWGDVSHWSTSSGGTGGASYPVAPDTAIFDTNSAVAPFNVTVAVVGSYHKILTLDTAGLTQNVTFLGNGIEVTTASTHVLNNVLVATMLYSGNSSTLAFTGSTGTVGNNINLDISGTITLASDIAGIASIGVQGTFTTAGYAVTARTIGTIPGASIYFANSYISITNYVQFNPMSTISAAVSTIDMLTNNNFFAFSGGGKTFGTVIVRSITFEYSNTFNTLTILAGSSVIFSAGTTQTFYTLNAVGTFASKITVRSTITGSKAYFNQASGTANGYFLDLKDNTATGGATFNAVSSTNSGNVSGWNFIGPQPPIADFTASPTSTTTGNAVTFTDLTYGVPTNWVWNFGDSTSSILQNPVKYYAPGTYTVTLTATNTLGSSVKTRTNYITVSPNVYLREAKGTLLFSGDAIRKYLANREAKGTLLFSGFAYAIRIQDASAIEKKTFLYKVYNEQNEFVGVLDDVIGEPNWSEEINTAGSSITLNLARNSDSLARSDSPLLDNTGAPILDNNGFTILTTLQTQSKVGPGSIISHNYRVDIYTFYGQVDTILDNFGLPILDNFGEPIQGTVGAPNGIRRFSGFISEINTKYGDDETTDIQLMSYGFDLDQYPITNSLGETTVPFNSFDPSDIVRDGMDQFTIDGGGDTFTTYNESSVETSSTVVSYTFRNNTYLEMLEKAIDLAPVGWYFYVDLGNNLVNFKSKPSEAQHTFYLGKHIKSLNLRSYIGDVVNDVIFTGGGDPALFKRYTHTPLTGTRRGLSRNSDSRVELESSADILSEGELDEKETLQYRTAIDILDKTYDIESIHLGDMVAFRNFNNYVDLLMMQVVALNYTPDVISLQLDTLPDSTNKRLEDIRRQLKLQENINVPNEPDV